MASNQKLIISTQNPTPTLADANIPLHWQKLLIRDLPGINPALARTQGMLTVSNISELVIKHCEDQHKKALLCQAATAKWTTDLLGPNVHNTLRLTHMKNVAIRLPLLTALALPPKMQHLATLKDAFDGAAASLAAWVDIFATPALLKHLLVRTSRRGCSRSRSGIKPSLSEKCWRHAP